MDWFVGGSLIVFAVGLLGVAFGRVIAEHKRRARTEFRMVRRSR